MKRYRLVAYLRIEPENEAPMTYTEALSEQEQQELISPENLYQIEEIPTPIETQNFASHLHQEPP